MRLARLVPSLVLCALTALTACTTTSTTDGVDVSKGNATTEARYRVMVDEMRYMHGQELLQRMYVLASNASDAEPAVLAGATSDDWLVRSSCMWVLGAIGDRRNIQVVQSRLTDPVSEVRYQAASTLVRLGDGRGFKTLVEGLADGELSNRFKCFQALKFATGQDFGYRHDGAPEDRRHAVGRWLEWLEGMRTSAL